MEPTIENSEVKYAGFGKRYAARIIDGVVIAFFCGPIYSQFNRYITMYLKKTMRIGGDIDFEIRSKMFEKADLITFIYFYIFIAIVTWCYFAGMESSPWKGTIGKKILGLEVTDEEGERISFIKASGRYFGKIISGAILYIGYLAMLGNNKKQTWHDSMSGCVVKEK